MISILTPTRWRPQLAKRFADSVANTARGPYEMLFWVDDDDDTISDYENALGGMPNVEIMVGHETSVSRAWNCLAEHARGELLMMGNDDLVAVTPGWDRILNNASRKYFTDGIYVLYCDDDFKHEDHCAFPVISRKWYETVGYFTPPYFRFGYNDTWLMDVAKMLGRLKYVPDAVVAHRHFTHPTDPTPRDRTTEYARDRNQARDDRDLYTMLAPVRERDAALLARAMK
jgi:glycosyl transferase/beta-hydroxylase protein BlmF